MAADAADKGVQGEEERLTVKDVQRTKEGADDVDEMNGRQAMRQRWKWDGEGMVRAEGLTWMLCWNVQPV